MVSMSSEAIAHLNIVVIPEFIPDKLCPHNHKITVILVIEKVPAVKKAFVSESKFLVAGAEERFQMCITIPLLS